MEHMRKNIDVKFTRIYQQAERMSAKVNAESAIPSYGSRQMHRSAENPECISHTVNGQFCIKMSFRFNAFNKRASKLLLNPSVICDPKFENIDIQDLLTQYSNDLPNSIQNGNFGEEKIDQIVLQKQIKIEMILSFRMFSP